MLATIAAPRVLGYLGKARTQTAKAQISALQTALELYALDNGGYPPAQVGLQGLMKPGAGQTRWSGPYIKNSTGLIDPWGQPYQYRLAGKSGQPELFSLGRDNATGGVDEDQDVGP